MVMMMLKSMMTIPLQVFKPNFHLHLNVVATIFLLFKEKVFPNHFAAPDDMTILRLQLFHCWHSPLE